MATSKNARQRIPKLIMDLIPRERRERGHPRKTWIKEVQATMTTRNLEPDQWRNREEWRLVSGRRRQLLKTGEINIILCNNHLYKCFQFINFVTLAYRLCGLVVRFSGYRYRGPGFDPRRFQIF